MKFHVNHEERILKCSAKNKCRFGGDENHFQTKEEAKEFITNLHEKIESHSKKFAHEMLSISSEVRVATEDDVPLLHRTIMKKIRQFVQQELEMQIDEQDLESYNRDIIHTISSFPDKQEFWEEYMKKLQYEYKKELNRAPINQKFLLEDKSLKSTIDDAKLLSKTIKELDLKDLLREHEHNNAFEENGFILINSGKEQVVFYQPSKDLIWKTSLFDDVSSEEYIHQAILSKEAFPKSKNIRYVKESYYNLGDYGFVAQESLKMRHSERLSSKELLKMNLSGHDDHFNNYGIDKNGKLVAFDTSGVIWEDYPEYVKEKITLI